MSPAGAPGSVQIFIAGRAAPAVGTVAYNLGTGVATLHGSAHGLAASASPYSVRAVFTASSGGYTSSEATANSAFDGWPGRRRPAPSAATAASTTRPPTAPPAPAPGSASSPPARSPWATASRTSRAARPTGRSPATTTTTTRRATSTSSSPRPTPTCSISGYSGVYDAAAHGATGTCTGIGLETPGTLALGDSFTNVPGGTAHWTLTGNDNYNDQAGDVDDRHRPRPTPTCSVSGYSGVYDAAAHGATGTCTVIGLESAGTSSPWATASRTSRAARPTGRSPATTTTTTRRATSRSSSTTADADLLGQRLQRHLRRRPPTAPPAPAPGVERRVRPARLDLGDSFTERPRRHDPLDAHRRQRQLQRPGGTTSRSSSAKADADLHHQRLQRRLRRRPSTAPPAPAPGVGVETAGNARPGRQLHERPGRHGPLDVHRQRQLQRPGAATSRSSSPRPTPTCSVSGYTGVYDAAAHGATGTCTGLDGEAARHARPGRQLHERPGRHGPLDVHRQRQLQRPGGRRRHRHHPGRRDLLDQRLQRDV